MSQIDKISFEEKTNPVEVSNRGTQATAEDFNEIKTVVNNLVDGVNWIKCDEAILEAGDNVVPFNSSYPDGVSYFITVLQCKNSKGYIMGHSVPNETKTKNGFTVNVDEAGTLVYLAIPQR